MSISHNSNGPNRTPQHNPPKPESKLSPTSLPFTPSPAHHFVLMRAKIHANQIPLLTMTGNARMVYTSEAAAREALEKKATGPGLQGHMDIGGHDNNLLITPYLMRELRGVLVKEESSVMGTGGKQNFVYWLEKVPVGV